MTSLIYIAGAPRSGSSAIEDQLAEHYGTLALGELTDIWSLSARDMPCMCGESLRLCRFWRPIVQETLAELKIQENQAEYWTRESEQAVMPWPSAPSPQYIELWACFFRVLDGLLPPTTIATDSSKSFHRTRKRLANLGHLNDVDLICLHPIRGIEGTVSSSASRGAHFAEPLGISRRSPIVRPLRASTSWMICNFTPLVSVHPATRTSYQPIAYEGTSLGQIARSLGLSATSNGTSGQHTVGGNRARFKGMTRTYSPPTRKALSSTSLALLLGAMTSTRADGDRTADSDGSDEEPSND